jgi:hypothetical protein
MAEVTEGVWKSFQKDLASRSLDSCRTVSTQNGHFIPLEQPERVATAIARVVGSVREHRPLLPPRTMVE